MNGSTVMDGMLATNGIAVSNSMDWIYSLNTSPFFAAALVLLINLGGRYLPMDLSRSQERFMTHPVVRKFILFAVLFLATRNIAIAFILTVVISIVLFNFLHEDSVMYIGPGAPIKEELPLPSFIADNIPVGLYA